MKLSFLARFTIVTVVAALICAGVLSYVLGANHVKSVQSDLVANAVGQTSQALTTPISHIDYHHKRYGKDAYAAITALANGQNNFQEYVRGIRVYWPDGSALYPAHAAPAVKEVQRAIAAQDVRRTGSRIVDGERIFTAYVPLADPKSNEYAAVAAIDFSVEQISSQTAPERRLVFLTTLGAITLIVLSLLTLAFGAQRELNRRERLANETLMQTLEGVATIVDKRDPYTAGHSRRVASYSCKLALRMGLSAQDLLVIEHAALLHDIGKIGVPDSVLLKPGRLTQQEMTIMQFHPDIGGEILRAVEAMQHLLPCIIHHHERWDGNGYPRRLAAHAIPLGARVIAVADSYDAMTTDRPYRRALSVEVAKDELERGAGTQFDADCARSFIHLINEGQVVPPIPATDLRALSESFGPQLQIARSS